MVTRKENIRPIIKEQMRGGDGRAVQTPVIDEAQFCGHGRLFAKMTREPGCSIGWHEHHGESETFYILAGAARYCDNGEWVTLRAGDCAYTPSGEGHSIANAGTQPLEFMALIVKA